MQVEMSRSEFKQRISALVREGHGRGSKALLLRWEFSRRPFFKKETKFPPAALYSNTLWLKPREQSEFDFLAALLKHMGESAEELRYLHELHCVERERYASAQVALTNFFESVRLVKPVEAVAKSFSAKRTYLIKE